MDYKIKSGDNLWNIAKNNYECSSNGEIQETVNQIVKENNIENPDLIYSNQTIYLPQNDKSIFDDTSEDTSVSKTDEFDIWTSEETLDSYLEEGKDIDDIDDFEMFEYNRSTYSTDLKNFAQEYIDKYDEDDDHNWNLTEFINMATSEEGIPDEYSDEYEKLYENLFNSLNLDDETDTINAGEFASMLFVSDIDWDVYDETNGELAPSIDGKLDYYVYQQNTSYEDTSIENIRKDIFDNYYAQTEN